MQEITTKRYGGEVKFTNMLAKKDNLPVLEKLFNECGLFLSLENATAEVRTEHNKRIDIVVTTSDGTVAIECQDATGDLDPVHVSKVQYYAWAVDAAYSIILCERSSDSMRKYVEWQNHHPEIDSYLVQYRLVQDESGEIEVCFTWIVRPLNLTEKSQTSKMSKTANQKKRRFETNLTVVFAGQLPFQIEKTYKGVHYTAEIQTDGSVLMNGELYSLNQAANAISDSSAGGWVFWNDTNGVRLYDLRMDFINQTAAGELSTD